MRNNDDNLNNIFSIFTGTGIDKLINIVADMVDNNKDEMDIKGDIKPDNQHKITGKYGVKIKLGPSGMDNIDNIKDLNTIFNKQESTKKVVVPVTDIFEEKDSVTIVSELPGVLKEDVELEFDGNAVTLNAARNNTSYSKKITLKFTPDLKSVVESFHNSIYSVVIKKKN